MKFSTNFLFILQVTLDEVKTFIGLRVYMSIVHLPENSMYWSKDWLVGGHLPKTMMKRDRFDKISQYFHAANNATQGRRGTPGYDPLHHVRKIHDMVLDKCLTAYNPHQNQSVDEAMIAFRGRLSFRQYLPNKPTKYGIKVWCRADPADGYLHQFQVYTGRLGLAGRRETGLATRVVLDMASSIKDQHHIINADNFFTSPHLATKLLEDGTYYRGTARTNRRDFPSTAINGRLLRDQGQHCIMQKGELMAAGWRDKRVIHLLSTADQATSLTSVQRKQRDGSVREVPCPAVVENYNKHMNGVDHADQLRTCYSTYRTAKKLWLYVFWFLFDVAMSNAFVLMKSSQNHQLTSRNGRPKERSQLSFRKNIAKLLLGQASRARSSGVADPTHYIMDSKTRGRCRGCSKKRIRHETKWMCSVCKYHICPDCFKVWHQQLHL